MAPSKRSARRPALSVREFVRDVEAMLSFDSGAAFWPGFQRSAEEAAFQEVAPCVLPARRPADYAEERNVLWNWCDERLLHRCSETAGTKLVRVLLQGFYTAELLLCVKPLEDPASPAGSAGSSGSAGSAGSAGSSVSSVSSVSMGSMGSAGEGDGQDPQDPRGSREIGVWWTPLANETANCRGNVEPEEQARRSRGSSSIRAGRGWREAMAGAAGAARRIRGFRRRTTHWRTRFSREWR